MSCADVQTIQAGNGSKTQFSFDFPYLFKTEIEVSFWNATTKEWDVKATTDATYPWRVTDANPTIVEFTSTAPPLPTTPVDPNESSVDNVRIRRTTSIDDIRALFSPGSAIRSDDLNKNFEQLRYAIQEANCQGVTDEVYQYLLDNYWDRFDNTLYSADTWRSDDATIATTAALDQRFQDEVNDTLTKAELAAASDVMPDNDVAVPTTGATKDYIDHVIETDILVDGTGLNKSGSGGQVTIGISAGSVDLDRIKAEDIITSAEANPNNDTTIATTAKIDDMIDAAITGDIAVDSTGLTVTDDGDGTITLGIAANSVDFDRIKDSDIITRAEQDAGTAEADTNIFTALAAAKRFDTLVQTSNPGLVGNWEVGKTWLQNDDDLTLSIWNGSGWTAVTSGGTFTEQPSVVYVDQASGDNNNTGHRISTPKASIKSAIEQINGEISLSTTVADGFNGGSGYVDAVYSNVSLTHSSGTGIGTGLTASITVSSGAVTAITLSAAQQTNLEEYSIGDVLTASNADLGGSGSGLLIPITGAGDGQIVVVSAGVYQEIAPIQIKRRNVSVIGQALRSCIVHPTQATETNNLFELNSGSYLSSMTFTGIKAGTGTGNTFDATLPTTQGWNAAFYSGAFITKSPYIQNCTNFSDSEIDNSDLRAHRPRGGAAGDTDSAPTGGGLLVNGATPATSSPLRSMVCDSYTHVALNGPGILVVNNGYAQCTSSYAFFNRYHIKCLNGGQANLAASTTDFGDQALVADGKSTTAIFTAALSTAASDQDITFTIDAPTADASWHGSETRPQSNMLVELNSITYPILSATANGGGWDVTISRPNPNNRSENLGLNGAVATPATASFFLRSQIASSGHTMEYVGSGTNYNALPENGGVPDEADQIVELNNGKVWTAITDHNGKFKIGGNQTDDPIFEVDQQLGFVTIPEGSIAFNLLSDTTPQLGGNLDVNGHSIVSTSDGNIALTPDGTGVIQLNATTSAGSVIVTGQELRVTNGAKITSAGNESIVIDPSGIGKVLIASALSVDTTETNADLTLEPKGTGSVNVSSSRITSVTDPTDAQDAATKNYVDNAVGTPSSISTLNTSVATSDTGTNGTIRFTTDGNQRMQIDNAGVVLLQQQGTNPRFGSLEVSNDEFKLKAFGGLEANNADMAFWTGNNSPSEKVRIDSAGRLLVGTSAARSNFYNGSTDSPAFQIEGTGSNDSHASIVRNQGGEGATLILGCSGGTSLGSNTLVSNGDRIGHINFQATDGAEFVQAANIKAEVDGGPGANDMPGRLVFSTTADGASSPTERMRIDSSGRVKIGNDTNYSAATGSKLAVELMVTAGTILEIADQTSGFSTFESVKNAGGTATDYGGYIFRGRRDADDDSLEYLRIDSSGRVRIGNAGQLIAALNVHSMTNGNIHFRPINDVIGSGTGVAIDVLNDASTAVQDLAIRGSTTVFRNASSETMRIDGSGRLLIGTSSARTNFYNTTDYGCRLQLEGTDGTTTAHSIVRNSNDNGGSRTIYAKTRGTSIGSNTVVQSGDQIGAVSFQGSDGTEFVEAAVIECFVDATPGADDMPGRLVFSTTADEASSPTERLRIASTGAFGLSGANYGTSGQVLTSQGSGSAPSWQTAASFTNAEDGAGNDFEFNSGYGSNKTAYGVRAWANVNAAASPSVYRGSGNMGTITDRGTGRWTFAFASTMVGTNYAVATASEGRNDQSDSVYDFTTTSFKIDISSASYIDPAIISIVVVR